MAESVNAPGRSPGDLGATRGAKRLSPNAERQLRRRWGGNPEASGHFVRHFLRW
jgi:hypothetical protein